MQIRLVKIQRAQVVSFKRAPTGKIIVNGIDANLEQVKTGMAWHYKQYQREQSASDRAAYADAENEARTARRGLWQEAEPTPPWDWRRQQKTRKR